MELNQIFRRIKYAQWGSVAVSGLLQLTWVMSNHGMDRWEVVSSCLLCLLLFTAAIPVDNLKFGQRSCLMVAEIILATMAMTLGSYRLYGLVFLVIAGKTAIILESRLMWFMAAFIIVSHTAASLYVRTHYGLLHGTMPLLLEHHFSKIVLLESQLFFVCSMTIALFFGRTLLAEAASRRAAERLAKEIETMTAAVERSRIARDMHDTIGHGLTSLNIQLELTSKLLESKDLEKAEQSLQIAREAAKTSLEDVRNTVRSIRDEDFSLEQSVQAITERIGRQQEINFEVKIDDSSLSTPCRHNLLMIMQECLTNVQKHSKASRVSIELDARSKQAHLTVKDNGIGFQRASSGTGCGIKGIEERALSLGGVVDIISKPGEGTAISVTLPT